MNREGHENTRFFTGDEVEQTPMYGKKTLFVVGIQPVEDILHWAERTECEHIYFGANHSFPKPAENTVAVWKPWEDMIVECLEKGHWCTLDIDVSNVEGLAESKLIEYIGFIPMLSVKLPNISQLGYNATLKLDDKDFAATNPGVWCHSVHDLMAKDKFTHWADYQKDSTIS